MSNELNRMEQAFRQQSAAGKPRQAAREAALRAALDAFAERAQHLGDTGSTTLTYRASLGRNLGYYTGMVFEASRKGVLIGGGGRYDGLCSLLGAPATVPAVGFSIAIDRLEDAA